MIPRLIQVADEVVARRLGDRMVLVQLHTNEIFELNETSARLWELLAQDGDVDLAERRLADEFDVDPDQVHADVDRTLAIFVADGLIEAPGHG